MTSFMIIVIIALFLVQIGFTWYRLDAYEGTEKVIICAGGILLSWAITSILFSISTNGIDYASQEIYSEISRILVMVFTPINGILFMPYTGKLINQIRYDEITKQEATKKIIIFLAILLVIFFVEIQYLKSIQLGIFDIANSL